MKFDPKLTRDMKLTRKKWVQPKHDPFFFRVNFLNPNTTRPLFFPTRTRGIRVIFESCRRVATRITTPNMYVYLCVYLYIYISVRGFHDLGLKTKQWAL